MINCLHLILQKVTQGIKTKIQEIMQKNIALNEDRHYSKLMTIILREQIKHKNSVQ